MSKGRSIKPDFTAVFDEKYAIVFEMSRTFPRDNVGLEKEMSQLFEYDMDIPIFNGKEHINVDSYDIILLLSIKDSLEIANRIAKYMEREDKKFKHNFIVMEYISNYMDTNASYCFRKVPLIKSSFTNFFPDDLSLSKQIDENLKPITVEIKHMQEYKMNGVLCNDDPPPAYLAAYVWHRIMYDYMNEGQKRIWREKNPNSMIPIEVNKEDLKYRIEKSIRNGRIRMDWVKSVLEFLIECDLAERKSGDIYEIKYRNIYPRIKEKYYDEFLLEKDYSRELIETFIMRSYDNRHKPQQKEEEEERIQRKIEDFMYDK